MPNPRTKENRGRKAARVEHPAPDRLRKLGECARVWGISRSTLNELLRVGRIGYTRAFSERLIPDSEMAKFIAENRVAADRAI